MFIYHVFEYVLRVLTLRFVSVTSMFFNRVSSLADVIVLMFV